MRRSIVPISRAWKRSQCSGCEVAPSRLARCIECLQRVRGHDEGTEVRASPAAPPRLATRATPTQMLQCRNLRAPTLVQRLRRCSDGHRGKCALGWTGEQRASAESSDAARVSVVSSTMTCSAQSSSDAPVCASLERAAPAQASPLLLAWVADNRQCNSPAGRCSLSLTITTGSTAATHAGPGATSPSQQHGASLSRPLLQDTCGV